MAAAVKKPAAGEGSKNTVPSAEARLSFQVSCAYYVIAFDEAATLRVPHTQIGTLPLQGLKPALRESTLEAVEALGFKQLTPVQAATLPLFLTNKVSIHTSCCIS